MFSIGGRFCFLPGPTRGTEPVYLFMLVYMVRLPFFSLLPIPLISIPESFAPCYAMLLTWVALRGCGPRPNVVAFRGVTFPDICDFAGVLLPTVD